MRRQRRTTTLRAYSTSRRGGGTKVTASAALLCIGALLAGCGTSGSDEGYVAVGAAGPAERGGGDGPGDEKSPGPQPSGDGVDMVPLDKKSEGKDGGSTESPGGAPGTGSPAAPPPSSGAPSSSAGSSPAGEDGTEAPGPGGGSGDRAGDGGKAEEGRSGDGSGGDSPADEPAGPAALKLGKPERARTGDRWCEKVTVTFRNTGGSAVKSGTVTFATHIVGGLGVDWGTIHSERKLPVPVGAGEKKEKTWKVCVDKWRVPVGMHIDTQTVDAEGWKP